MPESDKDEAGGTLVDPLELISIKEIKQRQWQHCQ